MEEDLMRGLIRRKRAWDAKCTASMRSVKTLSSSMGLLEKHLLADPSLAHWPRPKKEVSSSSSRPWCPPLLAEGFFKKQHVKRWLVLLSILRVRRLRKKVAKAKLFRRIRKQQEKWTEQNDWSLLSLDSSKVPNKRGGKTRIRAAIEKSRLTRLINDVGGGGGGGGAADDDADIVDDGDDEYDRDHSDGDVGNNKSEFGATTLLQATVATFSEGGALEGKSTASEQAVMDEQKKEEQLQQSNGCDPPSPDARAIIPREPTSCAAMIRFRRVETSAPPAMIRFERVCASETKHAADLLAEFLRKSPWGLKFSRGLRRVQNSTQVLQTQCKGFVLCKSSRLAALEQLWRKLEPNAMAAARKVLHNEEVRVLLPRTPGLTPPWLQKTAYDLSIVREQCVEANHVAKDVAAKYAHLHQLQVRNREVLRSREKEEGDTAASRPATMGSTKKRRRRKKKNKRKRKDLKLPAFYSTDKNKAPDALVRHTCLEFLTKEKRRIFDQYMMDKEIFRRKLEAVRKLQTTEVKATSRMGYSAMAQYLLESPYSVEFALKVAEENQRMDRVFAHKKELMKQQKQLLSVPLEPLRIYSGGARQRFEAEQRDVVLALLRKRRLT